MTLSELSKQLTEHFAFEPTAGQKELIALIAAFLLDREERNLLLMKGYAGTGKTSIVKAIVDVLSLHKHGTVLLAPTGRSAKVLAEYSKKPAFTIHKKIYQLRSSGEGSVQLSLQMNLHKNTLFIVDEASMIANSSSAQEGSMFGGRALLDDLMQYVFNGSNCQLILIGDTAQLPPIGTDLSPALDLRLLQSTFGIKVRSYELKEVMRQEAGSGILHNATMLRELVREEKNDKPLRFEVKGFHDIQRMSGEELEDGLLAAYREVGAGETIVVCRSNKRANLYNQQIRAKILGRESELCKGDLLMAVKNNYFWLPETSKAGFIANGDMMEVKAVKNIFERYGFRFAKAKVSLIDYPDENELEILLLVDTLHAEAPALTVAESKQLYEGVLEDYMDEKNKSKRMKLIREDQFYNALQVKFAWALTCHKSQGGQWQRVFIEQGYIKDNSPDREYLRWLYTALTRAREKVYLVNFSDAFF